MNLPPVLRIARWELSRTAAEVDRRTVIALMVLVVALVVAGPTLATAVGTPSDGIYRVAIAEESQYRPVVAESTRLRLVDSGPESIETGAAELVLSGGEISHAESRKGRAALEAFRSAVARYNDRLMAEESDRAAAFPVSVTLQYRESAIGTQPGPGGTGDGTGNGGDSGDGASGPGETDGTGGGGFAGLFEGLRGFSQSAFGGTQTGTPGDIQPPFPMGALLIAFVFIIPLNPISQAYGASVMGERVGRRGEPLLVAPVSRSAIIFGKTIPYALLAILIAGAIAVAIGAGPVSLLAVTPIIAVVLGATFLAGLFARSFAELTFLTLAIGVLVTAYVFVPAVFTTVHPIASISPLSIVVRDLTGETISVATVAFATGPLSVVAGVMYGLGVGLYREEDLFTQRSPTAKALDAIAAALTLRRVPLWTALSIPLVFVAELFSIAILFVVPPSVALPVLFGAVAVIEELAKSLPVLAGFRRHRFESTLHVSILAGIGAGIGFALGEKLFLAAQVVGLETIPAGRATFSTIAADDPVVIVALLLAPFALHTVTAVLSALGARRSLHWYGVGLSVAILVHVLYNVTVVSFVV